MDRPRGIPRGLHGADGLVSMGMDAGRLLRDLVFYNLPHLATAGLCWWAPADTRSTRRAWRLLALAILLVAAGNVCFTLIPDACGVVAPTVSDDLYLAFYPVATFAMVLLVRDHGPRAAPAVWLDGLVVGLGLAAVVAALVPRAAAPPRTPDVGPGRHHTSRYPLADLTLLIVLATVGGVTRLRVDAPPCPAGSGAGHQPPHRPRLPSARPGRPLPRRRSRRPRSGYWPSFPSPSRPVSAGQPRAPASACPPSRSKPRAPRHRPWPVSPPSRY